MRNVRHAMCDMHNEHEVLVTLKPQKPKSHLGFCVKRDWYKAEVADTKLIKAEKVNCVLRL